MKITNSKNVAIREGSRAWYSEGGKGEGKNWRGRLFGFASAFTFIIEDI